MNLRIAWNGVDFVVKGIVDFDFDDAVSWRSEVYFVDLFVGDVSGINYCSVWYLFVEGEQRLLVFEYWRRCC